MESRLTPALQTGRAARGSAKLTTLPSPRVPLTGLESLFLACRWVDHSAYRNSPQILWISPLVGLVVAGWIGVRTRDLRYIPHALLSLLLLGVGIALAW